MVTGISESYFFDGALVRLNHFSPDFGRESWLAPNGHLRDVECNRRCNCNWLSRIEHRLRETVLLTSCAVNAKRLLEVEASKVESFETALKKNIMHLCTRNVLFRNLIQSKDILAFLPTSSGKSLLLQLTVYSWPVCAT